MRTRALRTAVVVGLGLAAVPVRAQVTGQATASIAAGATDNALAAPTGSGLVVSDVYTSPQATVQGEYAAPRVSQLLSYHFAQILYARETIADSQTHQIIWGVTATPTGRLELHTSLGGIYSRLNSADVLAAAAPPPMALPGGAVTYVGATALVGLLYHPIPSTLWIADTTVNTFVPLDQPTIAQTLTALELLRYEHQKGRNTLTGEASFGYLATSSLAGAGGVGVPGAQAAQMTLLGGGRRDLTAFTTVSLELGGIFEQDLDTGALAAAPAGRASLHYHRDVAAIDVEAEQTQQLTVVIGSSLILDRAMVRATLPLDRAGRLQTLAFATVERASAWNDGNPTTAFDLLTAAASLILHSLRHPIYASVDYNFVDQVGHGGSYPSLRRQVVLLTFGTTWRSNEPF